MKEEKLLTNVEVRIGIGVAVCLFSCNLLNYLLNTYLPGSTDYVEFQVLAACTGCLMCTQEVNKATFNSGKTRLTGVIIGGLVGICVVLLDTLIGNDYIFWVLCGIGITVNLVLAKLAKMPGITTRVSAITFCLVVLLMPGTARIFYALKRFVGTLFGAFIAYLITVIWCAISPKKEEEGAAH